ncbi:MAG: cytochrome c oxidase subunit 3 [Acidobacteriaceae bacterium]|nr:cytochrome c oxidase subunit 3 [Acidobacteriaceae bacterium]
MSTVTLQHETDTEWRQPAKGTVAMITLIIAESAIFTIFVVAYLYYIGRDVHGPTPKQVLEIPWANSVCLLSSSLFIMLAEHAIAHGKMAAFKLWWAVTFLLGLIFLVGTGVEWKKLIFEDHLTISTNLFGTTYYSLVGLHAFHVIVGLLLMLVVLVLALLGFVEKKHAERVKTLALYWHFVDVVWIVVFTVVYVVGR